MSELKEIYPILKKHDGLKDFKKINEKNKKSKNKALKNFRQYLLKYNKILSITFLIFVHVQISNNSYKINKNHTTYIILHIMISIFFLIFI